MSNTRCEVLPWILLPVAVAAIFSFILPSVDLESMYLVSVVALLAHIHYGACVVSLIRNHDHICNVQNNRTSFYTYTFI